MTLEPPQPNEPSELSSHERIRQTQDRTHTLGMLRTVLVGDPSSDKWQLALETLRWLEDYRTVEPLRSYLESRSVPDHARGEVARALASFDLTTTSAERRQWWDSDDAPLREFSLRLMEESEAEIVESVAGQDDGPLQAIAISTLAMGFESPEHQELKVRGLTSHRNAVRQAAVDGVIWDEPLSAEPTLRSLLNCGAEEIELRAADVLQYYPSIASLVSLRNRVSTSNQANVSRQLTASIDFIEGTIDAELNKCGPAGRKGLAGWAEAIDFRPADTTAREHGHGSVSTRPSPSLEDLADALDTTVGAFQDKSSLLRSIDWSTVAASDRSEVADRLATHPDPEVRTISTVPLASWNETEKLLSLAADEHAGVRKSAMYGLGSVDIDPDVAPWVLGRLDGLAGTASTEALASFARHARPEQRQTVLFGLAEADQRFSIRHAAIALLDEASMDTELKRLLPLLRQPPFVNWAVHVALLETDVAKDARPQDLRWLAAVDNIHVAAAAARVLGRQTTRHE